MNRREAAKDGAVMVAALVLGILTALAVVGVLCFGGWLLFLYVGTAAMVVYGVAAFLTALWYFIYAVNRSFE